VERGLTPDPSPQVERGREEGKELFGDYKFVLSPKETVSGKG
jgi:hypothetical protein